MPRKTIKRVELSNEQIALQGIEYFNKKSVIKELESQCKECRVPLEEYLIASGKELSNGSKIAVLPHADVEVHLKYILRSGKTLLPEAIDVLTELGLTEAIETIPIVREDVIERLYSEGKITDDILRSIYKDKSSYSFSVDVKSRMPDAPEEEM